MKDEQLNFFLDHPCPPDIFGFNHYLTSERFIDEKLYLYPEHSHGGNGKHCYADVEAVRVEIQDETGIKVLLEEAWDRYHQPIALTEVHLHCHREDQLKWFRHMYKTTSELNASGIPVKAITSWAMLGSYGWNKLLTQPGGDYEPGAFDISSGKMRPTALAHFIRNTISTNDCDHPFAQHEGWWQRNSRIKYGPMIQQVRMKDGSDKPILIIGKNGTLGRAFARICEERCLPYQLVSRQDCDISNRKQISDLLQLIQPCIVINAAGFVRVDEAETENHSCYRDNTIGATNLAIETNIKGIKLVSFSSDLVFDGRKKQAYVESDKVNPLNMYGKSKADAEKFILSENSSSLVVRTSAFFSAWDEYNFIHYVKNSLLNGKSIQPASDISVSPTYVPDLVNATLDLLIDDEKGIWHLTNQGEITWYEFALMAAEKFQLDKNLIQPLTAESINYPAPRPLYSVLGTERGNQLPSLENAFERFMREYSVDTAKIAMTA
jgi:dTDP-4-dehydrorhamnose reductase